MFFRSAFPDRNRPSPSKRWFAAFITNRRQGTLGLPLGDIHLR